MSAPSMPPDNSAQVESMRMQAAQEARDAQDRKDAARKAELAGMRSSAATGGRSAADEYFRSQGIDVGRHGSDIQSRIDSILSGIAADDPNPGSYFKDVGQSIYGELEEGGRSKAKRELDTLFAPDFETRRLPFTIDDPYLAGVEAEERTKADTTLRNLLDRGVITNEGYAAAVADLDKQGAGVKSRLNEIGTGLIGTGQQSLKDVANRGRTSASTLGLDQPFNAGDFGTEADRLTSEFLANLGTGIRSRITGNLFQTGGLGSIAGAAQGGQNTGPAVAAAAAEEEAARDDDENKKPVPLF